jgi:hypothetical protein
MNGIILVFGYVQAVVFALLIGYSLYLLVSSKIVAQAWQEDFEKHKWEVNDILTQREKEERILIEDLTRRPPKEWTLADFENLVKNNPDQYHIRFTMLDGTKIDLDKRGVNNLDPLGKRDPYTL